MNQNIQHSKIATLTRCENNPILLPDSQCPWQSVHVSNAGATIHNDKVHLLYRAEGEEKRSSAPHWWVAQIGMAISKDGLNFTERGTTPALSLKAAKGTVINPDGVEDPRITKIDDTYYIVYAITSIEGDRIALSTTKDFKTFEHHGLIMGHISQRTAGLFSEKINGKYVMIHRITPNIWVSETEDFKTFTNSRPIITTKDVPWCHIKLGIAGPPIKRKDAWALIFHGKDKDSVYRLGIAWLDLKNPAKVLKIQMEPLLEPAPGVESKGGFLNNIVYSCGQVIKAGKVIVYYGAGDAELYAATMPESALDLF